MGQSPASCGMRDVVSAQDAESLWQLRKQYTVWRKVRYPNRSQLATSHVPRVLPTNYWDWGPES